MIARFVKRFSVPLLLVLLTAAPAMARDRHGDSRGYDRRDDRRTTYHRSDRNHHDSFGEIVSDFLRDVTRDSRRSDRYYRRNQSRGYNSYRYDSRRDCDRNSGYGYR